MVCCCQLTEADGKVLSAAAAKLKTDAANDAEKEVSGGDHGHQIEDI